MSRQNRSGSTCRIVIRATEQDPVVDVYPLDANAYTMPDDSFEISPHQRLPMVPAGAPATWCADGTSVEVDGVVLRPTRSRRSRSGDGRVFAERGGVIVAPPVGGWSTSWREQRPTSTVDVATYRQRLRRYRREFYGIVALLVGYLAFVVLLWVFGDGPAGGSAGIYGFGAGAGAATYQWKRARRTERVLDAAELAADGPTRQMRLHGWWMAGWGEGPVAVATLTPVDDPDAEPIDVPLIGVPKGWSVADEGEVVEVRGNPDNPGAVTITHDGHVLWPAG